MQLLVPTKQQWLMVAFWAVALHVLAFALGLALPYSIYYRASTSRLVMRLYKMRTTSIQALADARAWKAENGLPAQAPLFDDPRARTLALGILTKDALSSGSGDAGRQNLSQTVGALLARTPLAYQDRLRITIYNANDPPEAHHEALSLSDLVRVVPLARTPDAMSLGEMHGHLPRVKDTADYAAMLRQMTATECDFALALDDSAIAGRHWMDDLLEVLDGVPPRTTRRARRAADDGARDGGRHLPPWVILRLFSSFNWAGWTVYSLGDVAIITAAGLVIGILCWGATVLFARLASSGGSEDQLSPPSITAGLLLFVVGVTFCIAMGKPNIVLRRTGGVHYADAPYSSLAIVYPHEQLGEYASILEDHLVECRRNNALELAGRRDDFFDDLVARNEWRYDRTFHVALAVPSGFQNIANVISPVTGRAYRDAQISHDFADDTCPVVFGSAVASLRHAAP